jgi:hypothetical protein
MSTPHPNYVQQDECPYCGHKLDCATVATGGEVRPRPGDISVCIQCASILSYDERLKLRAVDENEMGTLDADTYLEVARVQAAIRAHNSKPETRNPKLP